MTRFGASLGMTGMARNSREFRLTGQCIYPRTFPVLVLALFSAGARLRGEAVPASPVSSADLVRVDYSHAPLVGTGESQLADMLATRVRLADR